MSAKTDEPECPCFLDDTTLGCSYRWDDEAITLCACADLGIFARGGNTPG